MSSTIFTKYLRPNHAVAGISAKFYVIHKPRVEKTWPSAAGVEFGIRFKKFGVAANAKVFALLKVVPEFTGERSFSSFLLGYIEL